jgi:hypothetical protein
MRKLWSLHKAWGVGLAAFLVFVLALCAYAATLGVHSFTFDPFQTKLVSSEWVVGAGCPTGATAVDFFGTPTTVTDPACPTGDPGDSKNKGLVLIKTGPSVANFASADAFITGIPSSGITLTELGYDIRIGSHCGAGAPRFNVQDSTGTIHFVGCNSPAPSSITPGTGWERRRWDATALAAAFPPILSTTVVNSITIIFDEGTDTPPGLLGGAVLDNIDINTTLLGKE